MVKIHKPWHTNISLLIENGASMKQVQERAGYSSFSVTADIYAHCMPDRKIKLAQSIQSIVSR